MFTEWRRFKGWVVLEHFLRNPTTEIHVKELARRLNIGPLTASSYLKSYASEGLLRREKKANLMLHSLMNDKLLVKKLKQFYALAWLEEIGFAKTILKENPAATGIILYGTYANGEYDEHSDVDIIVFSVDDTFPKAAVALLGKDATLSVYSLSKWRKTSAEFRAAVSKNHVVLHGAGLPM